MKEIKYNNEISIGVDLGITSVGWAVYNLREEQIVDKGVYLFEEAKKAEDRRNQRAVRRRLKRRKHRIERLIEILKKYNIICEEIVDNNLLEKRIKGLEGKIEIQDIVNIIMYRAKHRGYIPFKEDGEDKEKAVENLDSNISKLIKEEKILPCYIEKAILEYHGKYRGTNYRILVKDYIKELKEILKEQSKYYENITEQFIEEITNAILLKRKFWEGPGGPRENQLTPYGRYRSKEDLRLFKLNSDYRKYLFEDLIGVCNIYSNEKKAPSINYYAEEFNFYNDMLNIRIARDNIKEEYIDKLELQAKNDKNNTNYVLKRETIEEIKNIILTSERVVYKDIFKKIFGVGISEFSGYKVEDGKENIAKFSGYKNIINKLKTTLNSTEVEEIKRNIEGYNQAMYYAQVSPDEETLYELLSKNMNDVFSENILRAFSKVIIPSEYKKYHSYSEKALKIFLGLMKKHKINSSTVEKLYAKEINSDTLSNKIQIYENENIKEGNLKYITDKEINNLVASPATKKSLRKAISIINRLFYKFGYPKYLCLENTKTLLSPKKQKEYEELMLENTIKRKNVKRKLVEDGIEVTETNINKYLLLKETEGKCIYCNTDKITIENSEIEHILPLSITSDDSFVNKVISCRKCNSDKKNRTPYEYLKETGMYEEYKARIQKNKNIHQKKKNNLLFEGEINKYEKIFKNRNLNDTAYATNELANQINIFKLAFTKYNLGEVFETNIIRVPGQFTGIIRDKMKINKDRDDSVHHAVDASIISYVPKLRIGRLMNLVQNYKDKYWNESLLQEYRGNLYENLYIAKKLKGELLNASRENTRFSREVVKKNNKQLFDANISKVIIKDGEYYKISQIDNIYEEKEIISKFIDKDKKKKFLCEDNDKKLYDKLLSIINEYKDEKGNPFVNYCRENNMTNREIEEKVPFNYERHGIKKTEDRKSSIIKKLRYMERVTTPFLLNKKSINKKENTNLMYASLAQYCTRVYKEKNTGKLYFMPIYYLFINKNTKEIDDSSVYYKDVYNKFVGKNKNEIEHYMDIFNNEYVRFKDKKGNEAEGLVMGFDKASNRIEMKDSKNIGTSIVEIKKITFDVLGLYNLNIK